MDFIFKLLFLGGKYISQAAGRTILEIYHRSIQFGKHVNVQYEKASEIIKPYDNMLELLNERVKEASEDDIHLACIGEELKKQLEEHLKRMPNVKYEEINELAAAKSCWKDKEPALALVEDVHEDENGLISKDLEYDKMYTDLYKDLSNVIVKNTSVNCPIDQIAVSLPTRNIAFKTSQTSEVQEFHDTTAFTQKLATSNKDEESMLTEALKDNNGELAETAFQPFHFEKHRKSYRCNPLPSLYSTDVSYMKYLIDHSPSDSYYKANAIGSYNGQAVDSLSCTKEQNRSSYTNLDEIIQINNKEIIKGLGEEIKNRMVLLKKNNEHFKTFEKRLHDRIIKSKVKQIAKDVELRSSILAQNTSHYNKFENRLEKKLKRTINKLITHRTLSSGNVDGSKRDLDESIKEIINLLKVNEKEFQKLEQKVTQRLIHEKLNSDNPFKANMKEKNAFSRYLSDYDKADRKERTKILEINEKVFKKFEKDMCNIVILEKNKPMDKEDKLISERLAKYHVNVHNDSTFNEPLNMDRLKLNTQRDFSLNQLKTQTTKKNEKKTLKYRSSMADSMQDARERANIIEANAKAFEIFENKMNNVKPTKLLKSSNGNDKDIKGSRVAKADDSEVDSIQIINTLKEVLDNSTIFKPPKLNSRVNSTDRNLHLEKIKKVLSTKKKADIIPRYISPVKKEINENPTTASIGVMHDEPQKLQQKCKAKNEKSPPKTSKGSEHSKQNIDETKNQKIEGNFRKHREKSDYTLKSDIKNEQETETFLATMKRLQKVVAEYKNELSKNSLPASDNVTSHKSEDKQKKELPQHKQIKFKGETDCKSRDHPLSEKENPNLSGTPTANLKDYQRSRIPKFHSAQSELRREQTMSKSRKQDVEIHRKRAKSESSVKMFDEEQIRDTSRKENQNPTNIKEAINQCRSEIDHADRKLSAKSSERRGKDNKVSSEDRVSKLSKENISGIKENSFPEYEKQGDDNNMKVATSKRINNHYYVVYKKDRATPEGELNYKHEKMVEFASKSDINREKVVPLNKAGFDKKVAESKDDKAINNKGTYSTDKIAKDSDSKLPQFNTKVNHANETDVNMSKEDFNDEKRNPVERVSTPKRTQSETRENDYRVMNASYNILRALKIVEDKLASEEKISKAASRNSETSTPKIRQQENKKSENFDLRKRIDRPEPFIEDLRLKHDNIHKMKSSNKAIYSKPLDISQEIDNCEVKTDMKVKSNEVDLHETNSRNQEGKDNATQYKESKVKDSPNHQDAPTRFFEYTFRKFQTTRKLKNIDIPKEEVLINKSKDGKEMIKPVQKIGFQNHNRNTQSNQSDQTVNVVNELKNPLRTLEEHKYSIPPTNPSISKIKEKAIIDNDAKPDKTRSDSPTANHLNKKNELNQYNKNIFAKSSSKSNERVNKEFDKDIENCEKTGADGGKNSNDTLNVGKLKLRKILAYVPADMQAFKILQNLYDINEKHKENMNMSENTKDRKVIQTNKMGEGINPKITTASVEDRTESPEKVNMERTANKIKQQKFSFKPFRQSSVDSKKKCDLNTRESELRQQDGNIELLRRHSAIPLRTEKQRLEVYSSNKNREDAPDKIEQNALPKNAQGKTIIKASNMKQESNKENEANHQEIKHLSSRRHETTDFNNKIRSEPQKGSSPPVEILTTGTTKVERQMQLSRKSFNNETKEMRESPKNTLPQANDSMCKKADLEPHIIYRRPSTKVNVKVEANPSTQNVELQTEDESKSTTASNSPFKIAKFSFIPIKQEKLQNDEKAIAKLQNDEKAIAKEKPSKDEINLQSTMSKAPTFTKECAGNTIKIQGANVIQQNETVNDNLVCKKQKIQSLLGELRKELLAYSKISSEENRPPIRELTDAISKLNSEAKRKEMQYKITKENLQNKKVEAVDKADKHQNLCKTNQDADQICKDIYQEDEENTETAETTETTKILFREAKFSFIPMKNVQNYMDPDVSRKEKEKDHEEINIQQPPKQPDPFPQNLSPLLRYFLRKQLFKDKEAPKINLGGDENAEENLSALETQDDFEISNAHLSGARSAESVYDRYPLVLKRKPTLQNTPKGALEWKMRFIQQSQLKGSTNESEQHHNQSPLPNNRSQMQFTTSKISTTKMQGIKNSTSRQLSTAIPIRKGLNPEISTYDIQSIRDIPVNNCKRNPIRIKKASSNMHESVKVMFFNK